MGMGISTDRPSYGIEPPPVLTRKLGLALLAVPLIWPSVLHAQEARTGQPSANDLGVPEIVVTAQFREQKLQNAPVAITAISAEQLAQRNASSIADIASGTPSVVLRQQSSGSGNALSASIRGLGQTDFNPSFEPGVGIYIDDVYYPRLTGANFDLLDVQRVEVLRGPQGTLTGKNSEGGAIRFISRKPDGSDSGYISATYGSRNRINLRGAADFTLAKDLFARISGGYASQDGYVDVIDYGCAFPGSGVPAASGGSKCLKYKAGDVGYGALRGMLRYNPSSIVDVTLSGDYTRERRHNGAEVLRYANNANPNTATVNGLPLDSRFICGPFCNYSTTGLSAGTFYGIAVPPAGQPLSAISGPDELTFTGWGVAANADFRISDKVKLTSITAYRAFDTLYAADVDISPAQVGYGIDGLNNRFWSQEARLNVDFAPWITTTFGGYYSDEKSVYYAQQDLRAVGIYPPSAPVILPLFPLQFIQNDPVRTKSAAAFATAIIKPFDALTLTLGGRYTHDSKSYSFFRYNFDGKTVNSYVDPVGAIYGAGYNGPDTLNLFGGGQVGALTGRTSTYSGNRFDYRISADYRFSPAVLAYATVSTGYKAGGVGSRPFNAAQARPFGPERLTSYELGLKTDLFDRRLRVNVAAYYNQFKGAQLQLQSCPQFGGPGPCSLPQNAGNAHVTGIEAEFSARPVDGLQIDGSISHLHWHWTCVDPQVVNPSYIGPAGTCSSDAATVALLSPRPIGVVADQWSLGAQYESRLGEAGTLTPRFDLSYQGSMSGAVLAPAAGSPSARFAGVDGYALANARLTWRNQRKDLSVALVVSNLFDRYYYASTFDLVPTGGGAIIGTVGRPREWAITLNKNF